MPLICSPKKTPNKAWHQTAGRSVFEMLRFQPSTLVLPRTPAPASGLVHSNVLSTNMSLSANAQDAIRILSTAGLSKDVIDLLTQKVTLLDEKVVETRRSLDQATIKITQLIAENKELREKLNDSEAVGAGLNDKEAQILLFFFDRREGTVADSSRATAIALAEASHYIGKLKSRKFLRQRTARTGGTRSIFNSGESAVIYGITQPGSDRAIELREQGVGEEPSS